MIELQSLKKHKINLSDYDFKQDIQNRMFFSGITKQEIEVFEEILFSSLKFPIAEIARNLEMKLETVKEILNKISSLPLIQIEKEHVIVNKEFRKYFDAEILKFDERFSPGMEYIQSFLKKVPIQTLPQWYQIPRSSDNIFDSLVEKIFSTPQLYQRHLNEIRPQDEIGGKIFDDLFNSEDLKLYLKDIKKKFALSDEALHEMILDFEFNFIGCLSYENQNGVFIEILTPFAEWKEFLVFSKNHQPQGIFQQKSIELFRESEYAFIEDIETLINFSKNCSISVEKPMLHKNQVLSICQALGGFEQFGSDLPKEVILYINQLIEKSICLGLATLKENLLQPTKGFEDWIKLDIERRAHFIYKHPNNQFLNPNCPQELIQEKNIREIEKSLSRLKKTEWVYFDDFLKGCVAAIGDNGKVELKKTGKTWKYVLPDYTEKEKLFIQIALLEWLFESGIVQTGIAKYRPCFRLTGLGKKMFS